MRRTPNFFILALLLGGVGLSASCKGGGQDAEAATTTEEGFKSTAAGEYEGLRTGQVDNGDVVVTLPAVGTLAAVTKIEVKSVLSGRVTALHVREGETVETGQALATLEPGIDQLRELSAIASGVEKAQLELADAQTDHKNTQELHKKGFASDDQLKASQKRLSQAEIDYQSAVAQRAALAKQGVPVGGAARALRSFTVTAPAPGIVVDRKVEVGEVVSSGLNSFNQGTVVFELADLAELKVDLFVNEVDIGKLSMNYAADVTVDAYRGRKWKGEVSHIAPQARLEGEIRGFDVEIKLVDEPGPLRPGMTANVDITGDTSEAVTRIPIESLFKKKGDDVVYVIEDGKPESKEVDVGLISLEWVEIKGGVDEGTEIALQNPDRFLEDKKEENRRRR